MGEAGTAFVFPEEPGQNPVPPVVTGAVVLAPEVRQKALAIPETARSIEIVDTDSLTRANDFKLDIEAMMKKVKETFDGPIEHAHALHKSLIAQKKKYLDPLEAAQKIIKPKISDYLAEQDRKRMEAQRTATLAEEQARQIADKASDKAWDLAKKGDFKKANEVVDKATGKVEEVLSGAQPIPEKVTVEGFRERTQWSAEVVDVNQIPREYMIPDMPKLNKLAVALKHQFAIPGVVARSKKV
ncbi:MAG: hypothetical protein ABFD80_04465 [Acidobacteriota bacterium]